MSVQAPARANAAERAARLWWVRLPLRLRRFFPSGAAVLTDGFYLTAWPRAGGLAPPLALLLGLAVGAFHPGFTWVFSESTAVLVLATALGVLSAHLGAAWLLGYAAGDLVAFHLASGLSTGSAGEAVRLYVPQLIAYGVLALLLLNVPLVTKGLLVQLAPSARIPRIFRFGFAVAGHAVLSGVLVYFWSQAAPILLRPMFTWAGGVPTVDAVAPLQRGWTALVWVAVAASLARMGAQGMTAWRPALVARVDAMEASLAAPAAARPLLPPAVRVVAQASWTTLLLAGMMAGWGDAVFVGGTLLLVQAARAGLLPLPAPLGRWAAWMERIPLLLRLAAGLGVVYVLARWVLATRAAWSGAAFRPVVLVAVLAFVVLYLFAPGSPRARRGEA